MRITLFQTLKDLNNPDHIEEFGPFQCKNSTAWLGFGFYFWDTYIELGHWWGETVYGKSQYVICKAKGELVDSCWDLHGNGNHRLEFEQICHEIVEKGISTKEKLLVPQIIEFFKRNGGFIYDSIRALGSPSISSKLIDNYLIFRVSFKRGNPSYLDLRPAVQVCLIHKKALSLRDYKIVYPSDYSEFYA